MPAAEQTVLLSFDGADLADGNRYANNLRGFLLDLGTDVRVEKHSEMPDSQDFGSTLVLVLGTTAISTLAHGIAVWLQRNAGARIKLRTAKGELVAEGLDSKDVPRIVEALSDPQLREWAQPS
jgi:hypothetical protein